MTPRTILHALLNEDLARAKADLDTCILSCKEFDAIGWQLMGRAMSPAEKDALENLLIRNRATDGAFLTDAEEAALLHLTNGGSLDDVLANTRIARSV